MKKFEITYFFGPSADYILKDGIIADIAASGITLAQLWYDTETNKRVLREL